MFPVKFLGFFVLTFSSVLLLCDALKEMELMAPYKIKNIASNQYLTTQEQGILGLRTGIVITAPDFGKLAPDQTWTLAWDPSMDSQHDGYRIESSHEYCTNF